MQRAANTKWIEFGAGRGYLALMLADVSGARDIVLNDRRGYRFKVDSQGGGERGAVEWSDGW